MISFNIYKVTHSKSGKIYIGQTKGTLPSKLNTLKNSTTAFGKLIKKEGISSFSIELLEKVSSKKKANQLEIFHIKKLNATDPIIGFNIRKGGSNNFILWNEELITISVRAPKRLSKWIDKKAQEERRSKSTIVVHYLLKEMAADPN